MDLWSLYEEIKMTTECMPNVPTNKKYELIDINYKIWKEEQNKKGIFGYFASEERFKKIKKLKKTS